MLFRPLLFLFSTLLLLLSCSNNLSAQTTTSGGLSGVVRDPSDAVVPDVSVEIRDNTRGTIQSAKTDSDGVYRSFVLAPGRYTLTVSHPGFREESQNINVLLGPAGTRNITLKIEKTTATVKVTDEVPLLQAENGDVSTTMNRQQISEVPNPGNDLTYIAQTAPGAIMNTDSIGNTGSGNFSILGMPAASNLFTLNGMNDNSTIEHHVNGQLSTGVLPEARGRGLGRKQKEWQLEFARREGFHTIVTNMRRSNARIIHLKGELGFEERKIHPNFYVDPQEDGIVTERHISPNWSVTNAQE